VGKRRDGGCPGCGAREVDGQRYCLACGERLVARDELLGALIERLGAAPPVAAPAPGGSSRAVPGVPHGGPPSRAGWGVSLPGARVSTLLVLAALVFGVAIGNAASRAPATLDAARPPLRVLLAGRSAATKPTPGVAAEPTGSLAAPPVEEATATAAPAGEASTPTRPAKPLSAGPSGTSGATGAAGTGSGGGGSAAAPATKLPAFKHVFVVMLSDEPYATAFGPSSPAHYLSHTLESRGELLVRYDAVAHEQLANEIALLSGQGPTTATAANCPIYADLAASGVAPGAEVLGDGCVYPRSTPTLVAQLAAKHLVARAYIEGIGEAGAARDGCARPVTGAADPTAAQTAAGAYATFRNPFLYFHSLLDSSSCSTGDVSIARLQADLSRAARTPSLLYIAPGRCRDGNPTPCSPGAPAGMAPADAFLARIVPQILRSPAYHDGGLLVITVDEAPSSGEFADSSGCCGQPRYPNVPAAGPTGLSPRGGGTVGALLLSPLLFKAGSTSQEQYNHFSLLRTIEDGFGVAHLGYAALPGVKSFEPSLFTGR
jgi:hypothetical protein